ncbi:hypothetical protein QF035_006779 [Streptomyces umbrinus]|uniref:Uncharacterized protein n=1 Tax=Streptomyces umbrinus TaxID=67370 RepID=A0ABU0T0X3_9ACTN|nr:hypothetical protein [Streptomyces umbrinus]
MPGGGEPGHVAAGLRGDHFGDGLVDAGDGVEQAGGASIGGHRLRDPGIQLSDCAGELAVVVQVRPGEEGVVVAEASGQGLGEFGDFVAELASGQVRELLRVAFTTDEGLRHGPARDAHEVGGDRGRLDPGVLQQLLQSLHDLPALAVIWVRARVRSRSSRTGCGGTNEGRTRPWVPSWASQAASETFRLAAGQILDLPGVDQDHVQVLGRQVVERLPVVAGGPGHDECDLGGEQVIPQGEHSVRGRAPGRGLVGERAPSFRTRAADARLGILLADVHTGAAFVQHVHGPAPSPAEWPSGTPFREGQGGTRILAPVLRATLHGSHGRTALSATPTCELTGITEQSASAGTNPTSVPQRYQPTSGADGSTPAHATGFTTSPARTEGALDR